MQSVVFLMIHSFNQDALLKKMGNTIIGLDSALTEKPNAINQKNRNHSNE